MKNYTLWFTGLSGAGKSAIAEHIKKKFPDIVWLDGEIIRKDLCSDLGFSVEDRKENMRRVRALCKLFNENGKNVITSFISPFEHERKLAKDEIELCYIIHCSCSLETCEDRDPKGLYKKVRRGEIPNFTGIDSPYEIPKLLDIMLDTENQNINFCVDSLCDYIKDIEDDLLFKL